MNGESENGLKTSKRGLWKWLLAGTVLLIIASAAAVLLPDDALKPYDDLKVTQTPAPDARTNGYLYLKEKWVDWPRIETSDRKRLKAITNGQTPPDQIYLNRLRKGRANSREEWRTALAMPEWRLSPPANDRMESGAWMRLPVQLLVFDAMTSLRAGDAEPAITLQREMALWIRRCLEGGDGVASMTVALSHQEMVADLGCAVLVSGKPYAGQVELEVEAMSRLWGEEPRLAEAWQAAVRREGAFFRTMMDLMRSETGQRMEIPYQATLRQKLLFKKNRTLNAYHELLRKVVSVPFQPFSSQQAARQAGVGMQTESDRPLLGQWNPNATGNLFLNRAEMLGGLAVWQYRALFIPRAMRVRLAMHRWQQAHSGQWPATLTALVPDFLPEVPKDPWNGAPLLWDQATRTVYAVGTDWNPDPPVFPPDDRGWVVSEPKAPSLRMELPPVNLTNPLKGGGAPGNP